MKIIKHGLVELYSRLPPLQHVSVLEHNIYSRFNPNGLCPSPASLNQPTISLPAVKQKLKSFYFLPSPASAGRLLLVGDSFSSLAGATRYSPWLSLFPLFYQQFCFQMFYTSGQENFGNGEHVFGNKLKYSPRIGG